MKPFLFLLIIASASASLPSAVVLSPAEIAARESAWLKANPFGRMLTMTDDAKYGTGKSMRPMLQPKDRMFFEAFIGQKLSGSVALVKTSYCGIPVAHLVYDETPTHVFLTGIANSRSDGWQPKYGPNGEPLVMGVLVGILRKE